MGSMKVTSFNGVRVYTVSGQRSFPSWIPPSKLKTLRKDDDYNRRIELIQDMNFETAATRIKASLDNEYIIVSGIYPPQVKVYETRELSMKFERHLDAEIVDFQILTQDYSKLAFLCSDRSVWLHAKYGSYYQLRIPRMGRDIAYNSWSADLILAASSPDLYRINLEQGRFLTPITTRSSAINVLGRSPVHGLLACGGEDGALECFDSRTNGAVGRIDAVGSGDEEVTAVRFDENESFLLAVGTSRGQVLIYDLRLSSPIHIKDHMYGCPVVDIKWHESVSSSKRHIISTDSRVVRIWDPETGNTITNIEPIGGEINDICVIRNSGLLFMAVDSPQMPAYFIPALGPAPRWCSYLENLTEELEEEGKSVIYDDFKFVTREDLEKLNLTNLIGTNLLHAYMHGFFMDYRLFHKAKAMVDPFAYETYRQQRIQEKLDAERAARITIKRRLPKVNKELAARVIAESEKQAALNGEHEIKSNLLDDERFKVMFYDKAFQVDEESPEYKLLHPNIKKNKPNLVDEHFDRVYESGDSSRDTDQNTNNDESDFDMSEEDSSSSEGKPKRKKVHMKKKRERQGQNAAASSKTRFYEVKDEVHADAFRNKVSLAAEHALPLEERISIEEQRLLESHTLDTKTKVHGRGRELSFTSKTEGHLKRYSDKVGRRGVKSLGLKSARVKSGRRGRSKGKHGGRK